MIWAADFLKWLNIFKVTRGGGGGIPTQNLLLNLDATNPLNTGILPSNGALVPIWSDTSGNSNDAIFVKGGGANNFYTNQINGLPVMSNDGRSGADQFYSLSPNMLLNANALTVYIVYQLEAEIQSNAALISIGNDVSNFVEISPTAGSGHGRQFSASAGAYSASFYSGTSAALTIAECDTFIYSINEPNWKLAVNGTNLTTTNATGGGAFTPSLLGATANNWLCKSNTGANNLTVNFGQILMYGTAHTPTQQAQVQSFLLNKWGFIAGNLQLLSGGNLKLLSGGNLKLLNGVTL